MKNYYHLFLRKLKIQLLFFLFISITINAQNGDEGFLSDTRINFDLGIGNKDWSFLEATIFSPIIEKEKGILALDLHFLMC